MYPVEVSHAGAALGRNIAPVWERAAASFKKLVGKTFGRRARLYARCVGNSKDY